MKSLLTASAKMTISNNDISTRDPVPFPLSAEFCTVCALTRGVTWKRWLLLQDGDVLGYRLQSCHPVIVCLSSLSQSLCSQQLLVKFFEVCHFSCSPSPSHFQTVGSSSSAGILTPLSIFGLWPLPRTVMVGGKRTLTTNNYKWNHISGREGFLGSKRVFANRECWLLHAR